MRTKRGFSKGFTICFSLLSLFLLPTFSFGATFCISNTTELQSALTTAASNGEDNTIKIVQGTYNGNFVYASTGGYSLTVGGGYVQDCVSRTIDPANTILDGGETDTVLALVSQEAANFSVEGLTLRNGSASTGADGGGLYSKTDGDVTLTNNSFTNNTAASLGGGAYVHVYGTATLTNNTFTGNTASHAGGAYVWWIATLTNNTFTENTAASYGGGAYVGNSSTLTNNTFTGNTAGHGGGAHVYGKGTLTNNTFTGNTAGHGGGAYVVYVQGTGTLNNNTFAGNTATSSGGGAYISSSATLTNNTFTGNAASHHGGGVYGGRTFTNNTFIGNTAGDRGGAVWLNSSKDFTLTNNTISANVAETEGGGVWLLLSDSDVTGAIYNNIIWYNSAPGAADLYIGNTGDDPFLPASVDLFNNDFDQSSSGIYIAIPFTIDPSNLDNLDPLFVGSSDYHLTALSPCINSGDNDAPDLPATDKDGNPRIFGGTVDMGAYEYNPNLPATDFTGSPTSGSVPLIVTFTDTSTKNPISWSWKFGDNSTSTKQNPTHTYKAVGTYTVSLTATNTAGSYTTTKTDYIDVAECQNLPVRDSEGSEYFNTIQEAYNNASEADTIQAQALTFGESLNFSRDIQIAIKGGYDCEYTDNPSDSTINGSMTISDGTIEVDKLTLQQKSSP